MDYKCVSCGSRVFDDKGLELHIAMGKDLKQKTLCDNCYERIWDNLNAMADLYGDEFTKVYDDWWNEEMERRRMR